MKIPNHVVIIMDGNRRWAKDRGIATLKGHQAGYENIKELAKYAIEKGVKVLSVFAFSTENFKRSEEEVTYLMDIFANDFLDSLEEFQENDVKVVISGRRDKLRPDVISAIEKLTEETKDNKNGIFNICLAYGGQQEIVDATKKIIKDNIDIDDINEDMFSKYLYNDLPPIDLLIRTSGELRISNFMIWQAAYAEFYFPNIHFPDFKKCEFDKAIEMFNKRERRFGGNK